MTLTEAVKELIACINVLNARNELINQRLSRLENQINKVSATVESKLIMDKLMD